MKNKVLSLVITIAMVVTLLASSGFSMSTSTSVKAAKTYKVAMILDSTISDGGWGAACYNAMITAAKASGFETKYTDGLSTANFASTIRSYCDLGFDLIFAPGNQYTDAVKEVAADYPKVDFALLNGTVQTKNIVSILPDAKQIGYMAGALAGLMTKTNKIGFIGGMELDTTKAKLASYTKGAKAVNSKIKVYSAYAGSFSDSAKGKEIADSMVSMNKVDVMFGDASAVDSGAREALAKYKGTYDIGQPADLLKIQKSTVIISSVVTDNARMLQICMNDVKNGTYGNKTVFGNLSNKALSVGTFSNAVSKPIQVKYMYIIDKIKKGTFIK
jgi:basic membrane protein A